MKHKPVKMEIKVSGTFSLILDENQPKPWRWKFGNTESDFMFEHSHQAVMDLHGYMLDKVVAKSDKTSLQELVTAFRISSSEILKEFNKYADELLKRPKQEAVKQEPEKQEPPAIVPDSPLKQPEAYTEIKTPEPKPQPVPMFQFQSPKGK